VGYFCRKNCGNRRLGAKTYNGTAMIKGADLYRDTRLRRTVLKGTIIKLKILLGRTEGDVSSTWRVGNGGENPGIPMATDREILAEHTEQLCRTAIVDQRQRLKEFRRA
jgi:hypothetical protein